MDCPATGVILRTRLLTETSLIVQWLTPEHGRISTVAKGARRPKSPFRGKLDLFFEARFTFTRSRRSDLHTLRELVLSDPHPALRLDPDRVIAAGYGVVLLERVTEPDTPLPEFHALFSGWLKHLETEGASPRAVLAFEARILVLLGLDPSARPSAHLGEGTRRALAWLCSGRWESGSHLVLSRSQVAELGAEFRHRLASYADHLPPPPLVSHR